MAYILKARVYLHSGQLYPYDICVQHSRATLAIATSDDVRAVLYSCPKEVCLSAVLCRFISKISFRGGTDDRLWAPQFPQRISKFATTNYCR